MAGGTVAGLTLSAGAALVESGIAVGSGIMALGAIASAVTLASVGAGGTTVDVTSTVGATVGSGAALIVGSGGAAAGTTVAGGGTILVLQGGQASSTVSQTGAAVISTGVALVQSGAGISAFGLTATGIAVGAGGTEYVLAGGAASSGTVQSGGTEVVFRGGRAVSAMIGSGGTLQVSGGGASNTVLLSGGSATVFAGSAEATTVSGGAGLVVSGGHTLGTTLASGAAEAVSGGRAFNTTVPSGASQVVLGQGVAFTTQLTGGTETVSSGGAASGSVVGSGGVQTVSALGSAAATKVNSGGFQAVSAGGVAASATISGGGSQTVFPLGLASAAVLSGGAQTVLSGAIASGTRISAQGIELVSSGGLAAGTVIGSLGLQVVASAASASATTVASGGIELVLPGGSAVAGTVNSGGTVLVLPGANVIVATSQAGANVLSSGVALLQPGFAVSAFATSAVAIAAGPGATEFVLSGGTDIGGAILSGGKQMVFAGGSAIGTTVSSGGVEIIDGGTASGTVLLPGGQIDVAALPFAAGATAMLDDANVLSVTEGAVTYTQHLAPGGGRSFQVTSDGSGGTVVIATPCYLRGTCLLTERGEVAVEDLRAGDRVLTFAGRGAPWKPVRWVGSTPFDAARHPRPHEVWPIRIRAGALEQDMPQRDLLVSPGHAMLIGGVLIQAANLVNGATIFQDRSVARGAYFHVEFDEHDIVLANGAPGESYLDTGNRKAFVSAAMVRELHPDFGPKSWRDTCRPLVASGRLLVHAKVLLLDRAAAAGYATHADPGLHLATDGGRRIEAAAIDGQTYRFRVPAGHRTRLISRVWTPAHMDPGSGDRRSLGVRVGRLMIDDTVIPLDSPGLRDGWHGPEQDGAGLLRWTDGCARLPAAEHSVCVIVCGESRYWQHDGGTAQSDARAGGLPAGR